MRQKTPDGYPSERELLEAAENFTVIDEERLANIEQQMLKIKSKKELTPEDSKKLEDLRLERERMEIQFGLKDRKEAA